MATNPLSLLLVAIPDGSPLDDGPTRAVLLMALLAFVVLGIGLIAGALLGGRWARRYGGDDLKKPLPLRRGEAPATPREPAMLRGLGSGAGEAVSDDGGTIDASTGDTRVG